METESQFKPVKLKDATNLINQQVNLLGIVIELRQPKQCSNKNWVCTLHIIDDSYPRPGLTVNVFSNNREELPKHYGMMILLLNVKMQSFDGGRRVNAACKQRSSSFALFQRRSGDGDFVCWQSSSNFDGEERYESSIIELGKVFALTGIFDQASQISPYKPEPAQPPPVFSFLREINDGNRFNLVCKVLHVDEDTNTIFVWDGTDAPPASIGFEDKPVSNLSVHTLLSRDILRSFPTVGTILRVSLSNHHLFHGVVKPGDWVKLCLLLLCVVDKGSWIGKVTGSTTVVTLAQDDHLVEKIMRIYEKRITSKMGHIPFWSFPSPPGLTGTDADQVPFVTLMDIITFPKVTYKYRCIVRVVFAFPSQVEDENGHYRVLLTLEDPTAALEAFLCDEEAEHFWGVGLQQNTEMLRKKWNQLLGITRESSASLATRHPPWIECCIFSYYTSKADPWRTRSYKVFGTNLLD
ncbi:protection of telomeres protein 1a isoform X1 [Raphanus sativus]|uniref:Protection of telomeres protein 1a isoform X1 n=1 Tax=Raphanus sativus TaxID=3726 RepID=A0A6J0L5W0_RAPSA|nr:protection of telomeres protein 1a isoform X1 [Raphanus sativus]